MEYPRRSYVKFQNEKDGAKSLRGLGAIEFRQKASEKSGLVSYSRKICKIEKMVKLDNKMSVFYWINKKMTVFYLVE